MNYWTDAQKAAFNTIVQTCVKPNGRLDYTRAQAEFPSEWQKITKDAGRTYKHIGKYFGYNKKKQAKEKRENKYRSVALVTRREPVIDARIVDSAPLQCCPRCLANLNLIRAALGGKDPARCPGCDANLRAVKHAFEMP